MHHYLNRPLMLWARRIQLILAISIYLGLLLISVPPTGNLDYSDSLLHLIGNFLLFSSAWLAMGEHFSPNKILFFTLPFAIIAELAQQLVDARTVDIRDVGANIAGLCIAYVVCTLLNLLFKWNP